MRSTRGLMYLMEPVFLAVVFIIMLATMTPEPQAGPNYRLMELHANDVLVRIVRDGMVQGCKYDESCIQGEIKKKLGLLSPQYEFGFSIVEMGIGYNQRVGERVSAERMFFSGNDVYTLRLWVWI
ncbi:MAG: hypothetical protein ABH829_04035 [archaeon]